MKQTISFRIVGTSPLIQHNGQLADPLNGIVKRMKAISGKRKKTDAEFEELARQEWYGSLYVKDGKVIIPWTTVQAALAVAARRSKKGQQAQYGIMAYDAVLEFPDQNSTIDELWESGKYRFTVGVRVQRNRVMRTRVLFPEWGATLKIDYEDTVFTKEEICELVEVTGTSVGFFEWRPRYGTFKVV